MTRQATSVPATLTGREQGLVMTRHGPLPLSRDLEAAGKDIAGEWFALVTCTSFVGDEDAKLRWQLRAVVEKIMGLLTTEPFAREEAESLGAGLSRLRYVRADVLGHMLEALAQPLVMVLSAEAFVAIQPRLYALTTEIMAGFTRGESARVATEQHAIHQALLVAQRQSEIALRASEDRNRAVITQVTEGIVLAEARSGRVLETNAAFQRLLGYTAAELAERFLHHLVAHERASVDANIREALRKGRHDVGERWCTRKDGTLVMVEASITAIETVSGVLLCSVVRDVTARARAALDLTRARRALAEGREAERLHLAQELHDGALQELLGAHLQLSAVAEGAASGRPVAELLPEFSHIDEQLVGVARELRAVVGELRPGGLDDAGLQGALEHYLTQLRTVSDNAPLVSLRMDPAVSDLPGPAALCHFRVAQEAVRNAFLHARARKIDIRLRLRDRTAILRVSDNGQGFVVPKRLSALAREDRFGLAGMAERVEWAEGRLRVRSRPTRGTTVTTWMPLPAGRIDDGDADSDPGSG